MQTFSAPFIFQEECHMKMEHVLFPFVFLKITDPRVQMIRFFLNYISVLSHDPILGTNKNWILEIGTM